MKCSVNFTAFKPFVQLLKPSFMQCEIWGSHSGISEDSSVLWCDALHLFEMWGVDMVSTIAQS